MIRNYDQWRTQSPEEAGYYGEPVGVCDYCDDDIFESEEIIICDEGKFHKLDCWEEAVKEMLDADTITGEELVEMREELEVDRHLLRQKEME